MDIQTPQTGVLKHPIFNSAVIVQDSASSEMREIHLGCCHQPDSSSISSLSSVASSTDVRLPKKSA